MTEKEFTEEVDKKTNIIHNKIGEAVESLIMTNKNLDDIHKTKDKFRDRKYKECPGLHIVLQGHLDLVSTRQKGK